MLSLEEPYSSLNSALKVTDSDGSAREWDLLLASRCGIRLAFDAPVGRLSLVLAQRVGSCYLDVPFDTTSVGTWCYLECYLM